MIDVLNASQLMWEELEWEEGKEKEVAIAEMTAQSILQSLQALQPVLKEPIQGPGLPTLGQNRMWSHILANPGT